MEANKFEQWAIVEVMGHRTFAGYVTEQTVAGQAFVRIDVPEVGQEPAFTKLIGAASIYGITPCSEEVARRAAYGFQSKPVHVYLPALPAPAAPPRLNDEPGFGIDGNVTTGGFIYPDDDEDEP